MWRARTSVDARLEDAKILEGKSMEKTHLDEIF